MTGFALVTVLWLRLHTGFPFPFPIDYPGAPEGDIYTDHHEAGDIPVDPNPIDFPPH